MKSRKLRMTSDESTIPFFYGPKPNRELICWDEARPQSDVPEDSAWVEFVVSDRDPGGNDVWDLLPGGRIEGNRKALSWDLQEWLRKAHKSGRKYLTVYYSTRKVALK